MTNSIGNVSGYGNGYPVGGFNNRNAEQSKADENPQAPVQNHEESQVDPAKVMEFLSANNFFVAPAEPAVVATVDPATQTRVEGYMENFEMIYNIIVEEFGEELALDVMKIAMDYLSDLAA